MALSLVNSSDTQLLGEQDRPIKQLSVRKTVKLIYIALLFCFVCRRLFIYSNKLFLIDYNALKK